MKNNENYIYDLNDPNYPGIFPLEPYMNQIMNFAQNIQFNLQVDEGRFCVRLEKAGEYVKEITIQAFYKQGKPPLKIGLFFVDIKRFKLLDNQILHKVICRSDFISSKKLKIVLQEAYNEIMKI